VVGIDSLDLSRLQPFLARNWAGVRGDFSPEILVQLLSGVALRVVWTISSSSQPQVSYHMPDPLKALLGELHLPLLRAQHTTSSSTPAQVSYHMPQAPSTLLGERCGEEERIIHPEGD